MSDTIYTTIDDLLSKANAAIGKKVRDLDDSGKYINKNSKGLVGSIIEEGYFHIKNNNKQEPDFPNLKVELKVTGFKWVNKNKLVSAKERLVITMINYDDYDISFYDSHCYSKIDKILMMLYEYEKDIVEKDFIISKAFLYEFEKMPDKDKMIIIQDYNYIINKIKSGKAHELSEADTMYLGACPKGANKKSKRTQPFSDELAMQRAFTFKSSYMTSLFRNYVFDGVESKESLIKDLQQLKSNSFEEILVKTLQQFENKTLSQIDDLLKIRIKRSGNKQYLKNYVTKMLNVGDIENVDEFEKANIQIKTIRVKNTGRIKENMSFKAFDFNELAEESWENSFINEMFSSTKFLFIIFDEVNESTKEYRFRKSFLWNMPMNDINTHLYSLWLKTHEILNSSIKIIIKNERWHNNFPKATENPLGHIRPHGRDSYDIQPLPNTCTITVVADDGSKDITNLLSTHSFTKQCFWLNNTYVEKIISQHK